MNTNLNNNRTISTILHSSIIAVGLLGSLLATSSATAASACKGLESSACSVNTSCGWVEGYERKDGRSVKAFCRTSSAKKTVKKSSVTTSSVAKKASASQSGI